MPVPSAAELDSFAYSDLQSLAKSRGLRANLRADKLLKTLKAHLEQETTEEKNHEDHSEIKESGPGASQNQEELDDLSLSAPVADQDESALASEKGGITDHEDAKVLSGKKKSLDTDEFVKSRRKRRIANTLTPNFKKLHEARFEEMESIYQYMERKKKIFEERKLLNELKKQPSSKDFGVTPKSQRERVYELYTPVSQRRSKGRDRGTAQSTSCVKGSGKSSATRMSVRFSATTKDNEFKCSLAKTPARKSPNVTVPCSTPKGQSVLRTNKLKTPRRDSAAVSTPFKGTAKALNTPISQKKPVFDLKASLSRPLNYEPHKGKLKPWGQSKENNCPNERISRVSLHKNTYKQPRFQTREEQRKKREEEQKEKKAKVLAARRGLVSKKK